MARGSQRPTPARESLVADRLIGGDIIRRVEEALVDLTVRHEAVHEAVVAGRERFRLTVKNRTI